MPAVRSIAQIDRRPADTRAVAVAAAAAAAAAVRNLLVGNNNSRSGSSITGDRRPDLHLRPDRAAGN